MIAADVMYLRPDTAEEAVDAWSRHEGARYLAGGTEITTAARRTVPASNAFVPAACGLVCGSEVVKDLLRKGGVYRGTK